MIDQAARRNRCSLTLMSRAATAAFTGLLDLQITRDVDGERLQLSALEVEAEHLDAAARGLQEVDHGPNRCGLAGSVLAQQAEDRSLGDLDAKIVDRGHLALERLAGCYIAGQRGGLTDEHEASLRLGNGEAAVEPTLGVGESSRLTLPVIGLDSQRPEQVFLGVDFGRPTCRRPLPA